MPYPNEWASRQTNPKRYIEFRRKVWGKGISAIYGIRVDFRRKDRKAVIDVQALRFSKKKWTKARAKAWLADHGFKTAIA